MEIVTISLLKICWEKLKKKILSRVNKKCKKINTMNKKYWKQWRSSAQKY